MYVYTYIYIYRDREREREIDRCIRDPRSTVRIVLLRTSTLMGVFPVTSYVCAPSTTNHIERDR